MTSEQDAVEEMSKHFQALREAADDAQYWHNRFKAAVQVNYDQQAVQVQAENTHGTWQVRDIFEQEHKAARSKAERAIALLGMLGAPWSSQLWKLPDLPTQSSAAGTEPSISAYADAS